MSQSSLAIQKKGRLSAGTLSLLERCGLSPEEPNGRLRVPCQTFPLDLLLIRDDDIPNTVANGRSDSGIVGSNVLREYQLANPQTRLKVLKNLAFARCRLSLAGPKEFAWQGVNSLQGKKIATSYPHILTSFLNRNDIEAEVIELSGSVEIAPQLGLSDFILDLVSSGETLRTNGLREILAVEEIEAVFFTRDDNSDTPDIQRLLDRFRGVLGAQNSRYIMMNAPKSSLAEIQRIAPGLSAPTVLPLAGRDDSYAIHMVAQETIFWETLEKLRALGAKDILVVPIEKMMS